MNCWPRNFPAEILRSRGQERKNKTSVPTSPRPAYLPQRVDRSTTGRRRERSRSQPPRRGRAIEPPCNATTRSRCPPSASRYNPFGSIRLGFRSSRPFRSGEVNNPAHELRCGSWFPSIQFESMRTVSVFLLRLDSRILLLLFRNSVVQILLDTPQFMCILVMLFHVPILTFQILEFALLDSCAALGNAGQTFDSQNEQACKYVTFIFRIIVDRA